MNTKRLMLAAALLCCGILFVSAEEPILDIPVYQEDIWLPLPSLPLAFETSQETVDPYGLQTIVLPWDLEIAQAEASPATEDVVTVANRDAQNPTAPVADNQYYRDSVMLRKLADEAFEYGDYDAAANHASAAAAAAKKSDEYVALRLKIKDVDDTIKAADARLTWARSIGAEKNFAERLISAQQFYDDAVREQAARDWDKALMDARKVLALLSDVRDTIPLPRTYVVRPWATTRDCFWNIAGYSFVYGNPRKWVELYKANRNKLRRPENPDLLHVGIELTIPSLYGEYREGAWQSGVDYEPISSRK